MLAMGYFFKTLDFQYLAPVNLRAEIINLVGFTPVDSIENNLTQLPYQK
jgi:hypothetical protein